MNEHAEVREQIIELKNLSKVYGAGHVAVHALDKVNLHIVRGEIAAIMGPSGSGKTTLLQTIGALLKPSAGQIILDGVDITALPERELPRIRLNTFGFIFQSANLLASLTARQNVELVMNLAGARGNAAGRRSRELLEKLGMGHRLDHRPEALSGGEKQRVAIARALANDPSILLADEPTANLDSKTGHAVTELLRQIAREQGKTIIIVSHDLRIRDLVDRVLWLEDGRLGIRWAEGVIHDPVCLMKVDPEKTPYLSLHEDKNYYFCSPECKEDFDTDPDRYRDFDRQAAG
ncbi:MAG: ATP-binding cassette domain-containing protein [Dehalogenimonas sp.]